MEYKVIKDFHLIAEPDDCISQWELEEKDFLILSDDMVETFPYGYIIDTFVVDDDIIEELLLLNYIEPIETKPEPPIIKGIIK